MRGSILQGQKPENVLKRAEELVAVNKKDSALRLIFDLLSNRRTRQQWSITHEKVMLRFLELCIEVKNSRYAKEGLHQYRNIALAQAPSSLEKVIDYLLDQGLSKTKEAAEECKALAQEMDEFGDAGEGMIAIEDLENDKTPEGILMEAVTADKSGSKSRERIERETLLPWLKFSWENLRTVIELLRHHQNKLENVYHATARKAFGFCEEYGRTTEFRRLCELLRNHLHSTNQNGNTAVSKLETQILETNESLISNLETRFLQLNVASSLRIWHEGFRTIEDIHYIMTKSEKKFSSKLISQYYDKLTQLFLVSENYLFHAYAYKRFYIINRDRKKGLSKEELVNVASGVLLAALAIPLEDSKAGKTLAEETAEKEKNRRMAQLLGFDINPKRQALLSDLVNKEDILDFVHDEVRQLYFLLEESFAPLDLVAEISPLLKFLHANQQLNHYVKAIEQLLVVRLVGHLSTIFETVRLDYFKQLLENLNMPYGEIETTIVKAVKARQFGALTVRIDHFEGCMRFGENIMESTQAHGVVSKFYNDILTALGDEYAGIEMTAELEQELATLIRATAENEHDELLERKEIIEKRKEDFEKGQEYKAKEEQDKHVQRLQEKAEEEKRRMQLEIEGKERAREAEVLKAQEMIRMKHEMVMAGVDISGLDLSNMSMEEKQGMIDKARDKQRAAAEEEAKKLKANAQKLDAMVRATRELEKPRIKELTQKAVDDAQKALSDAYAKLVEDSRALHVKSLDLKNRTEKMKAARVEYEAPFMELWEQLKEAKLKRMIENKKARQCLDKLNRAKNRLMEKRRLEKERIDEEQRKKEMDVVRKREEERLRHDAERRKAEAEADRLRREQEEAEDYQTLDHKLNEDNAVAPKSWARAPQAAPATEPQQWRSADPVKEILKKPLGPDEPAEKIENKPWQRAEYNKAPEKTTPVATGPWRKVETPEVAKPAAATPPSAWRRAEAVPPVAPSKAAYVPPAPTSAPSKPGAYVPPFLRNSAVDQKPKEPAATESGPWRTSTAPKQNDIKWRK